MVLLFVKNRSPLSFLGVGITSEMRNVWGRAWLDVIFGLVFSFENLGEVNYGMTVVSDLKPALSSHLLLLK